MSGEREHQQPHRVAGPARWIAKGCAERELTVGPRLDHPVGPASPECHRGVERAARSRPLYSRGTGGMATQTSSVSGDQAMAARATLK